MKTTTSYNEIQQGLPLYFPFDFFTLCGFKFNFVCNVKLLWHYQIQHVCNLTFWSNPKFCQNYMLENSFKPLHEWVKIDHSSCITLVNVTFKQKYNIFIVLAMFVLWKFLNSFLLSLVHCTTKYIWHPLSKISWD
jgi:hypothetical protein